MIYTLNFVMDSRETGDKKKKKEKKRGRGGKNRVSFFSFLSPRPKFLIKRLLFKFYCIFQYNEIFLKRVLLFEKRKIFVISLFRIKCHELFRTTIIIISIFIFISFISKMKKIFKDKKKNLIHLIAVKRSQS